METLVNREDNTLTEERSENLKTIEEDLNISFMNIYVGEANKTKTNKYNLFFLKKIDDGTLIDDVKEEIGCCERKEKIPYNPTFSADQVISLDSSEIKVWKEIKKRLVDENISIPPFSNFTGQTLSILIYELYTNKGKYYMIFNYKNSMFLKKRAYIATIVADEMKIIDKNINTVTLEVSPAAIIKNDKLYILNLKIVEEILCLEEFYIEEVEKIKPTLEDILIFNNVVTTNKKDKNHLMYGIKNNGIERFKNLTIQNRKKALGKLKNGYKLKTGNDLNIEMVNGKIDISNLRAEEKTYVIMLISGKSAIKIVEETLSVPMD